MRRLLTAVCLAVLPAPLLAQRAPLDTNLLSALKWRSVGPANMGGRVSGIAGNPHNPKVFYVAQALGGVWKTVNAGVTFTPIFDQTGEYSVSEVAIAPSDTAVIWVGGGEEDSRNTISPGNGVWKSTDAGHTWTHMGLEATSQIGRIVIDPRNADVVFVAALGRPWGPNRERGIYKTTDGGRTWRNVNFVSDRAGFVDIAMDPSNPDVLWAASWERVRGPYFLKSGGPGSGLWKSTDAGEHWTRVTGGGLPTTTMGRIGLAIAPSNNQYIYAMIEADSNPNPASLRRGFVSDTAHHQSLQNGLYRSTDGGQTWTKMNDNDDRPFYYSQVRVDPRNPDRVYWMGASMFFSNDGGKTQRRIAQGVHTDNHGFWIDPNDPDHYIFGEDGGVVQTYDRGRTYDALLQFPTGQFYIVSADMQRPFWICGGLQDNGSWCGPSQTRAGGITNADWININGGDGFYTQQDPTNPDLVYSESQGGAIARLDLRTWERRGIRPGGGGGGFGLAQARPMEDSMIVWRGDTTQPVTPQHQHMIDSVKAIIAKDTGWATRNRFNWETPFFLSYHNPSVMYLGGQRVYKSYDRGDHWVPISEDLSTHDTVRIKVSMVTTGGITRDATGAETHGTVTTIAESHIRPGILFAGTDDGNAWMTTNDGNTWTNITARFPGVPPKTWVNRFETSPFDSNTVYAVFDAHRDDNYAPYVYMSTDMGHTFHAITGNLPMGAYVRVIREDPHRQGLLLLGTEKGPFASLDTGRTWSKLGTGLPPVPVYDLLVHPRDHVLIAATFGRSIWTADIGALEDATDTASASGYVYPVSDALLYNPRAGGGGVGAMGARPFETPNPAPYGARIGFRVVSGSPAPADTVETPGGFGGGGGGRGGFGAGARGPRADDIVFTITDVSGDTVRTLRAPAGSGALRFVTWDLRKNRAPLSPSQLRDSVVAARRQQAVRDSIQAANRTDTTQAAQAQPGQGGGRRGRGAGRDPEPNEPGTYVNPAAAGGPGGGGGGGGGGAGALVEPGTYLVTATIDGKTFRRTIRVVRPENTGVMTGGWQ